MKPRIVKCLPMLHYFTGMNILLTVMCSDTPTIYALCNQI